MGYSNGEAIYMSQEQLRAEILLFEVFVASIVIIRMTMM